MDEKLDNFILLIQAEVIDDIRDHVYSGNSKISDKHKVMKTLPKPVTDYVTSMVLDNLMRKELLLLEDILDE